VPRASYSRLLVPKKSGDDAVLGLVYLFEPLGFETSGADLVAFFRDAAAARGAGDALRARRVRHSLTTDIPEGDPLETYRAASRPFPVGRRLWIEPGESGAAAPPEGRILLRVPASRAFGTGTHASTRLALAALEDEALDGRSVLDIGTGSGVLALAAAGLGAARAVGLDTDAEAVIVARENLRRHAFGDRVRLYAGPLDACSGKFDLVVANMLAEEILPEAPGIQARAARRGSRSALGRDARARGRGACQDADGPLEAGRPSHGGRMDQPVAGTRLLIAALPGAGESCRIEGEEAAHARARRVAQGDAVILVDGSGREAHGRIARTTREGLDVDVESVRAAAPEAHGPIHLLVAAIRSERLAWIAEKATELGASRVTLVTSERTQRFRANEGLVPRLERIIREAAKQAERARWPEVSGPSALADALGAETGPTRLILDPTGEPFPAILPSGATALLIGPEGGWTQKELETALAAGWITASLAAGKLRAETAAVAALTLARTALDRGRAGR